MSLWPRLTLTTQFFTLKRLIFALRNDGTYSKSVLSSYFSFETPCIGSLHDAYIPIKIAVTELQIPELLSKLRKSCAFLKFVGHLSRSNFLFVLNHFGITMIRLCIKAELSSDYREP